MRNILLIALTCIGLSSTALAEKNPLLWSVETNTPTSHFPPVTQLNKTYHATYTLQNNLPDPIPLTVTAISDPDFEMANQCNKTLTPAESCTVVITFTPSSPGEERLQLTATIPGRKYKLSPLIARTNPTGSLVGNTELTLPAQSYPQVNNTVKFVFTNISHGTLQLSTVSYAILINDQPADSWLTKGEDTCSGQALLSESSCTVFATLSPTLTGHVELTASVDYASNTAISYVLGATSSSASTYTSSIIISQTAGVHKVTFVNQCPFNVWYGITQNGTTATDPTLASVGGTNYLLPPPTTDNPTPSKELTFSEYIGGAIYPRTGCTFVNSEFRCVTGDGPAAFNRTTGAYISGEGPVVPITKIELTMTTTTNTDGVYDISLVDGMTTPASIQGIGSTSTSDIFQCPTMGATVQPGTPSTTPPATTLAACSWTIPTTSPGGVNPVYPLVAASASPTACSSSSICSTGEVCGLAYQGTTNEFTWVINRICGQLVGYWNANAICEAPTPWFNTNPAPPPFVPGSLQTAMYSTYSCGTPVQTAIPNPIYSCTGTYLNKNCYSLNDSNCCGCVNWNGDTNIISVTPNPFPFSTYQGDSGGSPKNCLNSNTSWISLGYPGAYQFKDACPTAYSYPDDDASAGGAICDNQQPTYLTYYQITFCPGGKTAGVCPSGSC